MAAGEDRDVLDSMPDKRVTQERLSPGDVWPFSATAAKMSRHDELQIPH